MMMMMMMMMMMIIFSWQCLLQNHHHNHYGYEKFYLSAPISFQGEVDLIMVDLVFFLKFWHSDVDDDDHRYDDADADFYLSAPISRN